MDPTLPGLPPLQALRTISEDSQPGILQVQSASPESIEGYPQFFPQGTQSRQDSEQSSTSSPTASGPSEGIGSTSGTKRNKKRTGRQNLKSSPPVAGKSKYVESSVSGRVREQQSNSSAIDRENSETFMETAIWDRKTILSIDGGGIRGYSVLLIIRRIMEVIEQLETTHPPGEHKADGPAHSSFYPFNPPEISSEDSIGNRVVTNGTTTNRPLWLPCHYFDYMAGTSTGGLIAIMLGRLRMNIDDCIAEYERLGARVFGHSRYFHFRSFPWWPRDKYNHKTLRKVIKDSVSQHAPKVADFPGGMNFAFDENRCRVVVIAYQKQKSGDPEKPYLFRTYDNLHRSDDERLRKWDRNPAQAHDVPIWKVARATAAAPTYFKPMEIDGLEYLDGGFGANNPCDEIYAEVKKMNNNAKRCVHVILSLGTGKNMKLRRFKGNGFWRYLNYMKFARKWAADSERTHEKMANAENELGVNDRFHYFRLNVEEGLGSMKLDEWRARRPVRTRTGVYLGKLRSRIKRSGSSTAGAPGAPSQENDGHTHIHQETRNKNENIISGENPPQDNIQMTELAQRAPKPQVPLQSNIATLAKGKETALNIHADNPSADPSTNVPKWFRPRNKTLEAIRKHTEAYLDQEQVQNWIKECANLLVDTRRERVKNNEHRWEKACFGGWYRCKMPGCPRGEKKYHLRKDMQRHLLDKHRQEFSRFADADKKLEEKLDSFKIVIR